MHTLHSYRLDPAQAMPPGNISPSVRCATRADLPAIVELHAIALPHFLWADPAPAFLRSFYSFAIRDLEGWLFVSEQQGRLAGFVAGFSDPSHLLQRIATHKLRLFTSVVSCLVGHPIQLPGLLRDTRKAICLRGEAATCSDAVCELVTIAVEPEFRRQGHGRALVQALIDAVRSHHVRQLRACVEIHDRGMGYFYQRLGFEPFRAFKTPEGKWMDEYVLAIQAERRGLVRMLIVERKLGEQIVVPACEMTVTVLGVTGKRVRLGVDAPAGIAVHRKEVVDRIARERHDEQATPAGREDRLMSMRVLIADADDYLLDSYRRSLERQGAEVLTATTGLECVERLRDSVPDVLVMDPALPWGWGDGVLAVMHEDADVPQVPVIILTDGHDPGLIYRLARFHVDGYQVKPIGAKQLLEQIQVVVLYQRTMEKSAAGVR